MKKLIAVLLAALFAVTLSTPAFAAPPPSMQIRLIVASYKLDGDALTPGTAGKLLVTLRNTHNKSYVRNITVVTASADSALLCQGRNQWYLPRLDAGKSTGVSIALKAVENAAAGVHTLTLDIRYEDAKGMEGTMSATVPVEVRAATAPLEQPRLRADAPEPLPVGVADPVTVKLAAHNLGKGTLYNLSATASGQGLTLVRDAYAGNLDSGKSADIELTLAFDKSIAEAVKASDAWTTAQPGDSAPTLEAPAEVTLTYEDADGKVYTQTIRFAAQANIPRPQEPDFTVPQTQQGSTAARQDPTGWVVAGIALVVAMVAIALSLWARRRRAAR